MGRDAVTFGEVLRQFRMASALSQEALAARAGLSLRGLSDLERGVRRTPYLATVRQLAEALGLSDEDRRVLLTAARAGTPSGSDIAPVSEAAVPRPPTSLIGRESDVAALIALLELPAVQLVTLTGPGGSGKTRLALEVAIRLRDDFAGRVSFVDLSPLRETSHVMPAIAQALGVREVPNEAIRDTLARVLAARRLLLVLDNCEQVIAVASDIAALLSTCPELTILATSREPLRVRAEHTVPVAPLALPDTRDLIDLETLAQVPSVALFVERAQAADPAFRLAPENASAVAAICRRLDGLPLAIELAASRVRLLPAASLLVRLEQSLSLLTSGARDAPARQRTLRETIAWSYDLLSPEEQRLFRRLSVFVGGWILDAAEAVVNPDGDLDVLGGIAGLIERSLVQRNDTTPGEPRYGMLETIREYGLEQLATNGEEALFRERHASWVLCLSEQAEPELFRADQRTWWERIEGERPNIRAALAWFEQAVDAEKAQRLAASLAPFSWVRGHLQEGQDWLRRALAIAGETSVSTRSRALFGSGTLAWFRGDPLVAKSLADQAFAVAQHGKFASGMAMARQTQAITAWMEGDLERALLVGEDAIAGLREAGPKGLLAILLSDLGTMALLHGDRARGEAWSAEGLALNRTLGNHWFIANNLSDLALVAHQRGDVVKATRAYAESARLAHAAGDSWYIASPLAGLAAIAASHDHPELAARLLGLVAAMREASGSRGWPWEYERDEQTMAAAQAALGDEDYARAVDAGRRLDLERAVDEAVAMADRLVAAEG
jgi:predicted ATPase/DNA-binding XRE family transcriptional regulator